MLAYTFLVVLVRIYRQDDTKIIWVEERWACNVGNKADNLLRERTENDNFVTLLLAKFLAKASSNMLLCQKFTYKQLDLHCYTNDLC